MRQARNTVLWLHHVADADGVGVRALAKELRTARRLAPEVGRLLNTLARRAAVRLVDADGRPPFGTDLLDTLIRAHYAPLWDAKKQAAKAHARASLSAEIKEEAEAARLRKQKAGA